MPYSYAVYTGNGSTTQFAITFPYIRKEHVKCYVNYVDTAYTYVNNTTIQLATAPANGLRVEVRRITPANNVLVDFVDGSTLVAADLDTSNLQHLYLEQELDDAQKQSISIDPATGLPTAANQRITNVANPASAQDAATKSYVDTGFANAIAGAAASAASASASQTAAQAAQTAAESARDQTLAAYDNFDDRYLGAKTSNPTLDNDGNPLIGGALYFNSVANEMRLYTGAAWVVAYVTGTASGIGFTPSGGVAATNVQAAIQELDNEKFDKVAISSTGPILQFENSSTSLVANDRLGQLDFVSNDNSANANQSRVRILADVTNTTGAGRLRFQVKASSGTTFSTPISLESTGATVGALTASSISTYYNNTTFLNNINVGGGTVAMTSVDTQIDVDITSFFGAAASNTYLTEFSVVGIYYDGTSTYSRLHKQWVQHIFYSSSTWNIGGANLIGTVYNTDATNFPAGAVNASKVLTVVTATQVLLRFQNRTTPAGSSSTRFEYSLRSLATFA